MEKKYIGCKIIKAEPMNEREWLLNNDKVVESIQLRGFNPGYKVTYPDGYVSWSPKETFEAAYREITPGELKLINN